MEKTKTLPFNNLWRIRQNSSLEIKQVAKLVGHKSVNNISHYENNRSQPNLSTVIKLMLIYKSDLQEMFPDLFDQCQTEVESNLKKYSATLPLTEKEKLIENIHSCTYERMVENSSLGEKDKAVIRKHITKIANKLAYL